MPPQVAGGDKVMRQSENVGIAGHKAAVEARSAASPAESDHIRYW